MSPLGLERTRAFAGMEFTEALNLLPGADDAGPAGRPGALAAAQPAPSALGCAADAARLCVLRPLEAWGAASVMLACVASLAEPLVRDLGFWCLHMPSRLGALELAAVGSVWIVLLSLFGLLPSAMAGLMAAAQRGASGGKAAEPFLEVASRLAPVAAACFTRTLAVPLGTVTTALLLDVVFTCGRSCAFTSGGLAIATALWLHGMARTVLAEAVCASEEMEPPRALERARTLYSRLPLTVELVLLGWPAAAMLGGGLAAATTGVSAALAVSAALCLVLPIWGASLALMACDGRDESRPGRSWLSIAGLLKAGTVAGSLTVICLPFFETSCGDSPVTRAMLELDTFRGAAQLFEARFQPLQGNSLQVMAGVVLQEIPLDPWGRPYHLNGRAGKIWSYGADGRPGGEDEDADRVVWFRACRPAK